MNENLYKALRGCAKGSWQLDMLKALCSTGGCHSVSYLLQGKAKQYQGRYNNSFQSMLSRLHNMDGYNFNYRIEYIPGPRGGEYGSIRKLVTL